MEGISSIAGYRYPDAELNPSHAYLLPAVMEELSRRRSSAPSRRVFDLGCGNGSLSARIAGMGFEVSGVDPSEEGIRQANSRFPELELRAGSAYDDLAAQYGRFGMVVSLEVVEHVYSPRKFAATAFDLLEPGGWAIVSTPYHGYLKNLALAASGSMDRHFTALWDHGHIKFWSRETLGRLLTEAGFRDLTFRRVGRIPPLAKSMIAIARRP